MSEITTEQLERLEALRVRLNSSYLEKWAGIREHSELRDRCTYVQKCRQLYEIFDRAEIEKLIMGLNNVR